KRRGGTQAVQRPCSQPRFGDVVCKSSPRAATPTGRTTFAVQGVSLLNIDASGLGLTPFARAARLVGNQAAPPLSPPTVFHLAVSRDLCSLCDTSLLNPVAVPGC